MQHPNGFCEVIQDDDILKNIRNGIGFANVTAKYECRATKLNINLP
jgi:hypothetical protein